MNKIERFTFTKAALDKLKAQDKTYEVADTKPRELHCRIRPSGHKSLSVYMRPKGSPRSVRVTLCTLDDDTKLPAVREEAKEIVSQMSKGINPIEAAREAREAAIQAEKKAEAESMTLQQALDMYIAPDRIATGKSDSEDAIKQSTADGYKAHIDKHLDDWRKMQLRDITPKMVRDRHTKIKRTAPVAANNVMRTFRAVYNYASEETEDANGVPTLPPNPVRRMKRKWTIEKRKENFVDQAELKDWWASTEKIAGTRPGTRKKEVPEYAHGDGKLARDYLQFVILTGMRRREASGLLWKNVNFRSKKITILDTKNKDNLELPLSDYLLKILERRKGKDKDKVFPIEEVKKFVAWIRDDSKVEFTVHDLRRSFITYAEALDIGLLTIKAMVNHRIATNDVTGGYARITVERMREPMQKVTDYVLSHAGVKTSNVVEIGKEEARKRG